LVEFILREQVDAKIKEIADEGISKIKGGLKVLQDMKYPQEILDLAKQN
jgi:hypothetical protein